MKTNKVWLILLGLLFISGAAHAGDNDANQQIQLGYDVITVTKQIISEVVQQVQNSFDKLANGAGFDDAGKTIMYFLFVAMVAWSAVKGMLGRGFNGFVEDFIVIAITFGFIQGFLWSGGIEAIEKFIDSIAASIAGEGLASMSSSMNTVANNTFTAVFDVLSMPAMKSNSGFDVVGAIVSIPSFMMQLIAKIIAAAFLVIGAGIYLANIIIAYGSIMIAKAIAPIMIPWLLFSGTSFIFDGWLRFFIGACLFKVVGAFFMSMTNAWISGITMISSYVQVDEKVDPLALYNGNNVIYMGIILMSMVSAYLMMLVPTIAAGLIAGSSRAGFSGVSALTNGVGSRGLNNLRKASENRASSAASQGGKYAADSAKQAMKSMKSKV